MKKAILFILAMASFTGSTITAQGTYNQNSSFFKFGKSATTQNNQITDSLIQWQERIILHLDKTKAHPSDYVFFKAYLLTGPDQLRVSASNVLKIELLNEAGDLVERQSHKIEDGTADGSLKIPKGLKSGNYFFRAYTQWMLNYDFEQLAIKKLVIGKTPDSSKGKPENPSEISAYSEGGHLVAGITNKLMFKSTASTLSGALIVDENGKVVSSITSYGKIGTTIFEPEKGGSYYLVMNGERIFQLPVVHNIGYTLQINNLEVGNTFVRIETSAERMGKSMILKGRSDGITYFEIAVDFKENNFAQIEISNTEIPNGRLDIFLVDPADNVWAQRPVLIDNAEYSIAIKNVATTAGPDNEATFIVQVTDVEGRPVQTSLSVSLSGIAEGERNFEEAIYDHGATTILRNRRFSEDLELLTSNTSDELANFESDNPPGEIRYGFQKGLDFYGQAYDLNDNLLTNTKIQVVILPEGNAIAEEVTTNSEGLFKLSDLDFKGKAKAVFRTAGENTKDKLVKVVPYENETPPLSGIMKTGINRTAERATKKATVSRKSAADFLAEDEEGLINLDEIILVANKSEKELGPSMYDIKPTRVVLQDSEKPKALPQMFLNVPGFNVADLGGLNPRLILPRSAGMGSLLWVIDGFPLEQTNSLRNIISIVPFMDIERIEILLGASAAVYGSRAAAGVILIYTKSGSDEEYFSRKQTQMTYNGYHQSLDFVAYKQDVLPSLRKLKRANSTLYWNPDVRTDADGGARITLSLPDTFKKLRLDIKAVNQNGKKADVQTVLGL